VAASVELIFKAEVTHAEDFEAPQIFYRRRRCVPPRWTAASNSLWHSLIVATGAPLEAPRSLTAGRESHRGL